MHLVELDLRALFELSKPIKAGMDVISLPLWVLQECTTLRPMILLISMHNVGVAGGSAAVTRMRRSKARIAYADLLLDTPLCRCNRERRPDVLLAFEIYLIAQL